MSDQANHSNQFPGQAFDPYGYPYQGAYPGQGPWAYPPPPPQHSPSRRRRRAGRVAAAALVAAAAAGGVGVGHLLWRQGSAPVAASSGSSGASAPSQGASGGGAAPAGESFGSISSSGTLSAIAAKVDPSLVDIYTQFGYQQAEGAGTGIVIRSDGIVLTNNHVINGATAIKAVDLGNGRTYTAKVLGYDPSKDVAVLSLEGASGLTTARLATSATVSPGEAVVAIGNAGGTGGLPSVAPGRVIATGQAISAGDELNGITENLTGMIETNADVQPGDSGGPLVNSKGQVVGIDTAASSGYSLSASSNQGFAIPISEAYSIASQILAGSSSSSVHVGPTAFLGVLVSPSSSQGASGMFGFNPYGGSSVAPAGAIVSSVVPGGPAAQAGLAGGDVITSFGSKSVNSPGALSRDLLAYKPGQKVELQWVTPTGQTEQATVTLASGPPA